MQQDPPTDEQLAVWFTPSAIRQHFGADEGPVADWVRQASDEDLRWVGEACLNHDSVWEQFHRSLVDEVEYSMEQESSPPSAA